MKEKFTDVYNKYLKALQNKQKRYKKLGLPCEISTNDKDLREYLEDCYGTDFLSEDLDEIELSIQHYLENVYTQYIKSYSIEEYDDDGSTKNKTIKMTDIEWDI